MTLSPEEVTKRYIELAIKDVAKQTTLTEDFVCAAYHGGPPANRYVAWARTLKFAVEQRAIVLQVDDILVVNGEISVKDNDYRKALNDLVSWNLVLDSYHNKEREHAEF